MEADPAEPSSSYPAEELGPKSVEEQVADSINEMLRELPRLSLFPCIYRVPDSIRKLNPECYTPRLVSIGPFHRDNPRLKPMEQHKLRFYKNYLERTSLLEGGQLKLVTQVKSMEEFIRSHYLDKIELNSVDFCKMILLDSVFIVELLIKKKEMYYMLNNRWYFRDLLNDILLIENQIPLFIADFFCNFCYPYKFSDLVRNFVEDAKNVSEYITLVPDSQLYTWGQRHFVEYLLWAHISKDKDDRIEIDPSAWNFDHHYFALKELEANYQDPSPSNPDGPFQKNQADPPPAYTEDPPPAYTEDPLALFPEKPQSVHEDHLLEITEDHSQSNRANPSYTDPENFPTSITKISQSNPADHLLSNPGVLRPPLPKMKRENWKSGAFTASRLREYGVKFKSRQTTALVQIEFKKKEGILIIPPVKVNEWTENMFRNLVAFEQCHHVNPRYASDYLIFMDGLVDTPEDVNILTSVGIIQDDLQDPEKVSDIFNNLYKEVITDGEHFLFDQQSRELNDYRRDLWHTWKATWYSWKLVLKNKYFTSPWSIISVLAAVLLLGLTILQAVCSVYQAKGKQM